MWFCWFHQIGTFTELWDSLQLSVKHQDESAPPSLRSWYSAGNWIVPFRSESLPQEFKYLWVLFSSEGQMKVSQQVDWCRASSEVDSVSDCGVSEGVDSEGEALGSSVGLCSSPHVWSWSLGDD